MAFDIQDVFYDIIAMFTTTYIIYDFLYSTSTLPLLNASLP